MDCKDIMTETLACKILNISRKHTFEMRKKAYFKMALRHHPDKPGGDKEKFQNVKEAYDFLNLKGLDPREESEDLSYIDMLKQVVRFISPTTQWDDIFYKTSFSEFAEKSIAGVEKISLKIFKALNVKKALEVYEIINRYSDILNVSDDLRKQIKEELSKKMNSNNIIILNPDIDDLLNDNIYKLEVDDDIIYIPLWHKKIYNKINDDDVVVMMLREPYCSPVFEYVIKENNDIYVTMVLGLHALFEKSYHEFNLGNKVFKISSNQLTLTKEPQMILFEKQGILRANKNDIYNSKKRGNVYVEVTLK